jgi:hypothetical protein
MSSPGNYARLLAAVILGIVALPGLGCSVTDPESSRQSATTSGPATREAESSGGARAEADNCVRCHNSLSPDAYSSAEWKVAVHHMRLRAGLTADEHRQAAESHKPNP